MFARHILSIALFIVTIILSTSSQSEEVMYDGTIQFVYSQLPTFEQYRTPLTQQNTTVAEDIDWSSDKDAYEYRTVLREALSHGPNFAGEYIVVSFGCGTSCQINKIINARTGKIVYSFVSTFGVTYRKDSNLLIADPPEDYKNADGNSYSFYSTEIKFYSLTNDEMKLLKSLSIRSTDLEIKEK